MSYQSESPFVPGQPGSGSGQPPEQSDVPAEIQTATFGGSGNLQSGAYDSNDSTLEITFSDGSKYRYKGVDPTLFEDLATANEGRYGSFGLYFRRHVRGKFEYERVSGPDSGDSES